MMSLSMLVMASVLRLYTAALAMSAEWQHAHKLMPGRAAAAAPNSRLCLI